MAKKKAPAKKVSHAKDVQAMYRDFMRLAGEVSHAKAPAKKKSVKKIVLKKKPPAKKVVIKKPPVFKRTPKKEFVHKPPRRKSIPIGGIAMMIPPSKPPPPREKMTVSKHWTYFDRDGKPAAPWDIEVGPHVGTTDDDDDNYDVEDSRMFADEDYSYEDIEADWGGYEHSDTGYADENT